MRRASRLADRAEEQMNALMGLNQSLSRMRAFERAEEMEMKSVVEGGVERRDAASAGALGGR